MYKIIKKEMLTPTICRMEVEAPRLAAAASLGASTTIRQMFGVSISFWIILYMVFLQSV